MVLHKRQGETLGMGAAPAREVTVVERPIQIKALSNPERARILTLLIERPGTAKQVADWIEGTRGRVHYHIKELEKAGLVELVAKVEKGGVIEKYYRAVARNFYVAQGIGEHGGLTGDVRQMISRSMLGWRRREMLDVDQDEIATRVVRDCLLTSGGDVVLVQGAFAHRDIIQPLVKAVERLGAHALVSYDGRSQQDYVLKWKEDIASIIVIEEPIEYPANGVTGTDTGATHGPEFLKDLVRSGMRHLYAGVPGYPLESSAFREFVESGKRIIYMGYPTPEKAEVMGLDYRALHDAWWTALDVDYAALSAHCERLAGQLGRSAEVHVTSAGGTDLTFEVAGREVFIDDGVISKWETEHRRGWGHLPAGKVIVAPVAGSANGVIHSEMSDYFGVPIRDIRIQFRDGAVVSATAGENEELLDLVLAEGGDAGRLAGGFEIGTNPQITNPVGYALWDSKSHGDATVWIGDNRLIGGENEAPLSWGFIIAEPTVELDGETVLAGRTFRFGGGDVDGDA